MIEDIVISHLSAEFPEIPVAAEQPEGEKPQKYIVVQKTGDGVENCISEATIAVQSYGPTLREASKLDNAVVYAMRRLIEHADVTRCSLNSDYNFTDVSQKRYRYQAVFDVNYYRRNNNGQ